MTWLQHSGVIKLHKHILLSSSHSNKRKEESEKSDSCGCSSKSLRSSTEGIFNFREHCLFCGEECQIRRSRKNPNRWREAYLCRTADREGQISFKESILRQTKKRNDYWGNDVEFRTNCAVSDLHAADARYHKDCMSKFLSNYPHFIYPDRA